MANDRRTRETDEVAVSGEDPPADERGDLAATEAFELLAHETRMAAMRALWEAGEPLRFSEIADRAGIADTGNFNYHFGKLAGHFVRKDDERYGLTRSGRQAMTAVIAGDVTERPAFDPVTVDESCPYCGARIELHHDADVLRVLCSSCSGTFRGERQTLQGRPNPSGTITTFAFPPAGLRDRDPGSILDAALMRLTARFRQMGDGLCPDCAGPVARTVTVCDDHDDAGLCETCRSRFVGLVTHRCDTCRTAHSGILALVGLTDRRVRQFFHDHDRDLVDPSWDSAQAFLGAEERLRSADPVDYEATWTIDGDALSMRVDGEGRLVDVEIRRE